MDNYTLDPVVGYGAANTQELEEAVFGGIPIEID
jgi:hypothetical protein